MNNVQTGSWNVSRTSPLGTFYEEHANLFVIRCRDRASVVVQVVQVSHGWWKETEVNEHRNYHLTDHVPQKNKTQQTNSHLWFNNHWEQLEIKNSSPYEHPSLTWMISFIIKRSYHMVSHNSTLKSNRLPELEISETPDALANKQSFNSSACNSRIPMWSWSHWEWGSIVCWWHWIPDHMDFANAGLYIIENLHE